MSVLIKGMEMPTSCHNCPMLEGDHDDGLCHAASRWLDDEKYWLWYQYPEGDIEDSKPVNCPLVPVSPHGDLIDRNKLYEKTAEWEAQALHMVEVTMHDEDTTEWRKWSTILTERSAFKFDVADAPTIIPASEEGE